jgi:hypothetical protein
MREGGEDLRARILAASGHGPEDYDPMREWTLEDLEMEVSGPFPESVAWYRERFVPLIAEIGLRLRQEPTPSAELAAAASEACATLWYGAGGFWEDVSGFIPVPELLAALSSAERAALCEFIALAASVLPEDNTYIDGVQEYYCGT